MTTGGRSFDDSWATPKLLQDFRLTISDVPTPPESGTACLG